MIKSFELNWDNHSMFISNFRKIVRLINNGNNCDALIQQGVISIKNSFNKLADIRWKLVKSQERIDNYIQLKEFLCQLKNLPLPIEHGIIKHGELILNTIESSLTNEEQKQVQAYIQKQHSENLTNKFVTTINQLKKELSQKNILTNAEKSRIQDVLKSTTDAASANNLHHSIVVELNQLTDQIACFPVSSISSLKMINNVFNARLYEKLKVINCKDRAILQLSNGISPSLESIRDSYHFKGQIDVTCRDIKQHLPFFRKFVQIERQSNNFKVFKTKYGLIHHFNDQINFDPTNVTAMSRLALKLAKARGWSLIHVWGSSDFKSSISSLSTKFQIQVCDISDNDMFNLKLKIETENPYALSLPSKKKKPNNCLSNNLPLLTMRNC